MTNAKELLRQGRRDKLWQKYCGHLDLSLSQVMDIQRDLLMEQIKLLASCELGRKILGDEIPASIEAFRKNVPITDYEAYVPYLPDKRDDVLPEGKYSWVRTSGRSKADSFKWIPCSQRMYERNGEVFVTALTLASCSEKGEVYLEPGDMLLMMTAPPPYATALYSRAAEDEMDIRFAPSLDVGEKMEFQERTALGFEIVMQEGLDYFYGISGVLAKIGEGFEQGGGGASFSLKMLRPSVVARLLKGIISAKLNRRNLLPRDLWKVKGIVTGGTDTDIYRDRIDRIWGRKPLEAYVSTEAGGGALQAWNYKGMTFLPDINFLEFIPYDEHIKLRDDPSYHPETCLLDELELGVYELVITSYLGGIFTRYRVGDLLEVIAMQDDELGIDQPQFQFHSRADGIIDIASFVRLTERKIWKAVEMTGVAYEDWIARKEVFDNEPILHLYLEVKPQNEMPVSELKEKFRVALCKVDKEFADTEEILGGDRLRVSLLPQGAFARYFQAQQEAGADIAQLKPPHMQPPEAALNQLMGSGRE